MKSIGALAAALLTATAVSADVLPPDSRWIDHIARFDNVSEYPDFVFYVYPRDLGRGKPGNSSIRVPANGEVNISGVNPLAMRDGLFLFAVSKKLIKSPEDPPEESWFIDKPDGVLKSAPLGYPTRTVRNSDTRKRIVTSYRIEMKDGLQLVEVPSTKHAELSEVFAADDKQEGAPFPWRWIVGGSALAVAVVMLGIMLVRRGR